MSIASRAFGSDVHRWLALLIAAVMLVPQLASAANRPPIISGTPPTTATVGQLYSFTPKASDPEGQYVSFGIRNQPAWATFSRTTGTLSGTPTAAGVDKRIQIYAWDGMRSTPLPRFNITVQGAPANRPPTISGTPATTATAGTAYSFRPTASDPDGNTVGFSISNRPTWATFSTTTGQLSGTPGSSNVGTFSNIVISVSDGKVSASLPAF